MMRKQKATVWCDRAQYEDPRMLAAQRQAKARAAQEVAGGSHHAPPRLGGLIRVTHVTVVGDVSRILRGTARCINTSKLHVALR